MNIIFREYNDKDKDALLVLAKRLDDYVKSIDPIKRVKNLPSFSELSLDETLDRVKRYQGKIFLAVYGESIVGFVTGFLLQQSELNKLEIGVHTVGEVNDIYIDEEYRGKGIGKNMLNMMEDYFEGLNCDSILIRLFAPNGNAHKMYKNCGFMDREITMLKQI